MLFSFIFTVIELQRSCKKVGIFASKLNSWQVINQISFYLQSDAIKNTLHQMNRSYIWFCIDMHGYEEVSQMWCRRELYQPIKKVYVIVNWHGLFHVGHVEPNKSLNWINRSTKKIDDSVDFDILHTGFKGFNFEGIDLALLHYEKDLGP